ncbi:MAG: hypothetical protein F9K29_07680 [Hyphomicrobiaceae bacterium]|nr:MAG: hypothetical protein F9K29_07680 [Hyphomicrobiaceae bacterium]
MQLLASSAHTLAADLIGWAPLLSGVAVFALVMAFAVRHQPRPAAARAAQPVRPVAPLPQWSRAPETAADAAATRTDRVHHIVALQARASEQIDAAEYALDALLADCARVMTEPIGTTAEPAPASSARTPASEPLAA